MRTEGRVDARAVERRAAGAAGVLEPAHDRVRRTGREHERHEGGRDEVLPGRQDPAHVQGCVAEAEIRRAHVGDAVGVEREERLGGVGREHARRREAHQRPRVAPPLAGAAREEPDELELGVVHDGAQRVDADMPGRPLDDAVAQGRLRAPAAGGGRVVG
jgi:hypothetical protein